MKKLEILSHKVVAQEENKYLSFPDIIQDQKDHKKIYMVYRSGDNHHPTYSNLHILVSEDEGENWEEKITIPSHMRKHGKVWNCPRFSYYPSYGSLNIICDTKNSINETEAIFEIFIIQIFTDTYDYIKIKTEMRGMVPDKIVKFKNKLYCANHTVDIANRTLTQLINCSQDNGRTWYDCKILARKPRTNMFCEANIVNFHDKYLLAYLRDNTHASVNTDGKMAANKFYKYISYDGENWQPHKTLPIYGHRMTTYFDKKTSNLFCSYRNTKKFGVSMMSCWLTEEGIEKDIKTIQINEESAFNLYHCGYTGLVMLDNDIILVASYIKVDENYPFIKTCKIQFNP